MGSTCGASGAFRQPCWRLVPSPVWWPWLISLSYHIYWEMGDANKTKSGWVHLEELVVNRCLWFMESQLAPLPSCLGTGGTPDLGYSYSALAHWRSWAVWGMMGRTHMNLLVFTYIIVCPGAVFEIQALLTCQLESPRVTMKSSWCFALGLNWALTLPNMENWNV